MTHLIKLELKKFGIAQNIIFMFAAILFSILFITISLWDSMTELYLKYQNHKCG